MTGVWLWCNSCCCAHTLEQQLSSLGITFSNFSGSNCLLLGHANFTPGFVTGSTLLQVAACSSSAQRWRHKQQGGVGRSHMVQESRKDMPLCEPAHLLLL